MFQQNVLSFNSTLSFLSLLNRKQKTGFETKLCPGADPEGGLGGSGPLPPYDGEFFQYTLYEPRNMQCLMGFTKSCCCTQHTPRLKTETSDQ